MFDRISKGLFWDRLWRLCDGCTPCSPGCDHCWSARYTHGFDSSAEKFGPDWNPLVTSDDQWTGEIRLRHDNLDLPLRTRKPQAWLILNDLFHESIDENFIDAAFIRMAISSEHIFLLLTKRANEMGGWIAKWNPDLKNVWPGVTVCNQEEADEKIPELLKIPAAVRWVSLEPMLGEVDLKYPAFNGADSLVSLEGISWVVLGGETGPGARPLHPGWVKSVRNQCLAAGVPFFFKSWGVWVPEEGESSQMKIKHCHRFPNGMGMVNVGKKAAGRLLDGREWNELPYFDRECNFWGSKREKG